MGDKPVHAMTKPVRGLVFAYCGVDLFRKGVLVSNPSAINPPIVTCKKCLSLQREEALLARSKHAPR